MDQNILNPIKVILGGWSNADEKYQKTLYRFFHSLSKVERFYGNFFPHMYLDWSLGSQPQFFFVYKKSVYNLERCGFGFEPSSNLTPTELLTEFSNALPYQWSVSFHLWVFAVHLRIHKSPHFIPLNLTSKWIAKCFFWYVSFTTCFKI